MELPKVSVQLGHSSNFGIPTAFGSWGVEYSVGGGKGAY